MNVLTEILNQLSKEDARSVLYYLSRYLKQAKFFSEYTKDIFEEHGKTIPAQSIRNETLRCVLAIEELEGAKMNNFSEKTFYKWAGAIDKLDNKLDPKISRQAKFKAQAFLKTIEQHKY